MNRYDEYFKDINFEKEWDEQDWERFFQAQDQLSRESPARRRPVRPSEDGLSFRRVLRHFGMDPENPGAEPAEFSAAVMEPDVFPTRLKFWEEGAEFESLPIYCQAKCFAYRVILACDRHFAGIASKKYKSRSFIEL